MTEIILYLILLAAVGFALGLLIGRYSLKSTVDAKVRAAYIRARDELQGEKQDLAADLNHQLFAIRESILRSAEAYEGAVRAVEQRLGVNLASETARLEGAAAEQLQLEFKTDARKPVEPQQDAADEEPTIEEEIPLADLQDRSTVRAPEAHNDTVLPDDESNDRTAAVVNR